MKAGKADNENDIELVGKVVQKKIDQGTKSERIAVCLQTNQGSYVLRRFGISGMAFGDPELEKLVGKKITATGIVNNSLFLAKQLKQINK